MQAVILSGGQGSRLRPLTETMPKPSLPLVNRPMISYMVDWLGEHGVTDIVMSVGFLADGLRAALDAAGHDGVEIRYVEEDRPLGTAGAVKFAERYLDEQFLVLNGDVLTQFDISAEIAQHRAGGARATLALVPVDDPTAYGLVLTGENNAIEAFLEKPDAADVPPDPRINAGVYVLQREVLEMVPAGENRSFEHDVFPHLVDNGIHAFDADGYWLDLGTPERYLQATRDLLDRNLDSWVSRILSADGLAIDAGARTDGAQLQAPLLIAEGVNVGSGTRLGAYTVLGADCVIGEGCSLEGAVLQRDCTVGDNVSISETIVGPGVVIGTGASIAAGTVIGEGARIDPGASIAADSRVAAGAVATAI
ncbi:MAG: NDP-sugar synthase [Solirubrobacterales bacterium]